MKLRSTLLDAFAAVKGRRLTRTVRSECNSQMRWPLPVQGEPLRFSAPDFLSALSRLQAIYPKHSRAREAAYEGRRRKRGRGIRFGG